MVPASQAIDASGIDTLESLASDDASGIDTLKSLASDDASGSDALKSLAATLRSRDEPGGFDEHAAASTMPITAARWNMRTSVRLTRISGQCSRRRHPLFSALG